LTKNLNAIKCFMLDMDGTFYLGDHLLPGALEFMAHLQNNGIDYLFLTNNSSKHGGIYADKIRRMGFDVDKSKIFTSGEATTIYLKNKTDYRSIYLVGTPALRKNLFGAGFTSLLTRIRTRWYLVLIRPSPTKKSGSSAILYVMDYPI
jgi:4-nitrophenyl phosphatase